MSEISRRSALVLAVAAGAGCTTTATPPPAPAAAPSLADDMLPLSRLLGTWRGQGTGEPGASDVERSYAPVLGGRFIEVRNRSSYAPQPSNPAGEEHEDIGYLSFDQARDRFVLRQFHVEGFVNQYVAATPDFVDGALMFESEAIENIPAGWRARETYRFASEDAFEEVFELAPPDGDFAPYSSNRLQRA